MNYLDPTVPTGLRVIDVPVIDATDASMKGFGQIVRDPHAHKIEIVKWPVRGRRQLDAGTGDEGGTTEGVFACAGRATGYTGATKRSAGTM